MPFAMLWRNPDLVTDEKAKTIRAVVESAIQHTLEVAREAVEVRVTDTGPLDLDQAPIVIIIDMGHSTWRRKREVAAEIARQVFEANVLEADWISARRSCVRICGGAVATIGPS